MKEEYYVGVDTEFDNFKDPFLGSHADSKGRASLCDFRNSQEVEKLKNVCEDSSVTKIFHPTSVDWYTLERGGIKCKGPFEDTLTAATLVSTSIDERKGLKPLAMRWLGADIKPARRLGKYKAKYKKLAKKEGRIFSYADIPKWILKPYAIEDAELTTALWGFIKPKLSKVQALYDFEKSLTPAIIDIQSYGMLVDRAFTKKMSEEYQLGIEKTDGIIQDLLRQAGIKLPEFNPGSVKQLAWVLDKLDVPIQARSKWGPKTGAEHLLLHDDLPFVSNILLNRFYKKQKSVYFDAILEMYTTESDSVAHFFLFQAGTRSGRFSAERIQTIPNTNESRAAHAPKLARKIFIPRPGKRIVAVDYKGLQMVLFFHFSNAKKLIKMANEGWDSHSATSMMMFGKVDKELRVIAKSIGLGLLFGMGINKLTRSLKVGYLKGEMLLNRYHRSVPVKQFMEQETSIIFKQGYGVLDIHSDLMDVHREYHIPQNFAYKIVNYKIQGTEAYIMKHAIIRVNRMIEKEGLDARILMTVHDELLFEVGEKRWFNYTVKRLCETMEDHKTFKAKLFVDAKVGDVDESWGDVKAVDWHKLAA